MLSGRTNPNRQNWLVYRRIDAKKIIRRIAMIVDVVVEMPKYSKYKFRYENGSFRKIRKLVGMLPENYGCINNTIAPDNSPLDAIILTNKPLKQGRIKARVIGAIMREDKDDKIITVLIHSRLKAIRDISGKRLEKIISAWTGHPGQAPLKRIANSREAVSLVEKYRLKKF